MEIISQIYLPKLKFPYRYFISGYDFSFSEFNFQLTENLGPYGEKWHCAKTKKMGSGYVGTQHRGFPYSFKNEDDIMLIKLIMS